jgi:hypothetical protein
MFQPLTGHSSSGSKFDTLQQGTDMKKITFIHMHVMWRFHSSLRYKINSNKIYKK